MIVTLELSPEIEARLRHHAKQQGLAIEAYLLELASRDSTSTQSYRRRATGYGKFAGLGPSVEAFHAAKQEEITLEAGGDFR